VAQTIELTPEKLQEILLAVVRQTQKLNPIEQKKLDEELRKEHRRDLLAVELGKAEDERLNRLRNGCSHMRDPRTGDGVPRGSSYGEWTTSGQAYQNGLAMCICQRCATAWIFKPSPENYNAILQNGMLKQPPPPEELCYCMGCLNLKPKCQCAAIRAKENQVDYASA
jgi:hypothetical protein